MGDPDEWFEEYRMAIIACLIVVVIAYITATEKVMILAPVIMTIAALTNGDDGSAMMFTIATNFTTLSSLEPEPNEDMWTMLTVAGVFMFSGFYRISHNPNNRRSRIKMDS